MHNLIKAHERVKDFDWEHSYATKPDRYPTKYVIPRKTKDPSGTSSATTCRWSRRRTTASTARWRTPWPGPTPRARRNLAGWRF